MFNFKQRNYFAVKIMLMSLMICTFSINTPSLSPLCINASNINYHINLHPQTQQTETQKNNVDCKQAPLFGRLRKNFNLTTQFTGMQNVPEVQKHFKKFNQSKNLFLKTTMLASSNLYYILEQVEKRKLPGELVLLPMLESNFQSQAVSNRGAVGLWQFMPATGRQFGLKQRFGYDGRKDVKASTNAALNYLEYLHKKFNRDWMLTLAAYNAGEGTVERAIKHNKKAGKPTSFWFLTLPKQTREYVPKFLALTQMIR
ncbi:MAG TPA: transglycosylase SLT domain-containing protein [Gammaproteobacteria bacterium]|nr:transglycosylase SLT domain-containing protein [Gammaproteobacteria bacterium]